ncbi:butyrophilin-like protein 3, partial [Silurus asotus]
LAAVAGEDLVLPCFIEPNISALNMRVEWWRLKEEASLVHLYKDHKDVYKDQDQSYSRRTSLFKEELQKGDASLKLSALRVSDEGAYKCLIKDKSWYDDVTVHITVEAQGSHPVITMESYDNSGGINLVCESRGWKPEPEVLWLDREGATLPAKDTQTLRETEGFSVKRHISVHDYSDSNRFYCRLLQKHHMMETEVIINKQLQVVGSAVPIFAVAGEDLVLPCFIKPNTSAVDMTVEWMKLEKGTSLVHLYKDHDDRNEKQAEPYRRRTSLFKEELQKGNVSLKLSGLRVSDAGKYKCLIEYKSWYDDIIVQVTVEAQGSHPVITMESYDNSGGIHLVCDSRGWNPEPEVLWLDKEGVTLPAKDTQIHRDTEGFSVTHRINVYDYSDSNRFYCRLQQKHHMMETEIII